MRQLLGFQRASMLDRIHLDASLRIDDDDVATEPPATSDRNMCDFHGAGKGCPSGRHWKRDRGSVHDEDHSWRDLVQREGLAATSCCVVTVASSQGVFGQKGPAWREGAGWLREVRISVRGRQSMYRNGELFASAPISCDILPDQKSRLFPRSCKKTRRERG